MSLIWSPLVTSNQRVRALKSLALDCSYGGCPGIPEFHSASKAWRDKEGQFTYPEAELDAACKDWILAGCSGSSPDLAASRK